MTEPLAVAIPAATLVLFRERAAAPPELLMVERARTLAFAAGMLVFPGGRVDPDDVALAADAVDPEDAAARIAAIRETIEEVGIACGIVPPPAPATIDGLRAGLARQTPFAGLLAEAGLAIDADALVPFARWRPSHRTSRTFDARFYLARLPEGAPPARVDAAEAVRLVWASAADTLRDVDRGRAEVIFPTRRNLERLAQFGSFAEAAADAAAHPPRLITPFEAEVAGVPHLCIPDDLGYPVTSEPLASVRRG